MTIYKTCFLAMLQCLVYIRQNAGDCPITLMTSGRLAEATFLVSTYVPLQVSIIFSLLIDIVAKVRSVEKVKMFLLKLNAFKLFCGSINVKMKAKTFINRKDTKLITNKSLKSSVSITHYCLFYALELFRG